jgi:hypothetical protein
MYRHTKLALALIIGVASIHIFSAEALDTERSTSTSMDGSTIITCGVPTALFNGVVPPQGFMVQLASAQAQLWINDNGQPQSGFYVSPPVPFVTPPGYKPMGPVEVLCLSAAAPGWFIAARGW